MGNFTTATIIVVLMNVLMWFAQTAMIDINPNDMVCYNVQGSIIGNTAANADPTTGIINNDVLNQLPSQSNANVAPSGSTSGVTDLFNNILSWFVALPGINFLVGVVAAPSNIIKCMGLPAIVTTGLSALWYLITLMVFLAFIWWRD